MKNIDFYNDIPIYIISFNRLSYLKNLIEYLDSKGYNNVNIIDNKSTYEPLLDYYKKSKHNVIYMDKNYGHRVFWESGKFDDIVKNQYYVVSDPDILPLEDCPSNFIELFYKLLISNNVSKVGFSLKTDDIPVVNPQKDFITSWENQFYKNKETIEFYSNNIDFYTSKLDTTFALYRPKITQDSFYDGIRTGLPFVCRHIPWYDFGEVTEETEYYKQTVASNVSNYSVELTSEELFKKYEYKEKKLSLLERIFSITNDYINFKYYKVIRVFGIAFKIRRTKK